MSYFDKYKKYKSKYLNKIAPKEVEISVQEPWFSLIKSGQKTIEARLNKGLFAQLKPNDIITFFNNKETIKCKIIRKDSYDTFEELLTKEGLTNTLPDDEVQNIKDGVNIYRRFYSEETEKLYGVVAIHIILV